MTARPTQPFTRRAEFWGGVRATLPLLVGVAPFGVIFGAVAVANGISAAGVMAMSLLVFAGSAQFIASGLVAAGAGVALIILTTFIVNVRHSLYAATLAPHFAGLPQRWLLPLGFMLTDETFVVVAQRFVGDDKSPSLHWYYFGSALCIYVTWQLCTVIGLLTGQRLTNLHRLGLDFALPLTFIAMLAPLLRSRPIVLCATTAAVASIVFRHIPHHLGLIVAVIVGVGAGVLVEARWPASHPSAAALPVESRHDKK
jgi:4-azaleucine resistance transporter AzlC